MENQKRYYSVEEAMEIIKVNRDTIYRYLKKGILKSVKLGRKHFITTDSIDDLFKVNQ